MIQDFDKDYFWWATDAESKPHEKLFAQLKTIKTKQNYRYIEMLNYIRMYGQTDIFGVESPTMNAIVPQTRPQINIIQICANTLVSKIGKTAPKATFLTSDGDFDKQQEAKKLTYFSSGQFYRSKTYEHTKKALLDSCVLGSGFVKNYIKDKEIVSERVLPFELLVDDKDAIYGQPRTLYQEKLVSKEVLKAAFPEFSKEIEACQTAVNPFGMTNYMYGDVRMISVCEAWHLPSSKEAGDGKHIIAIANATIAFEEYEKDYFPFAKLVYQSQMTGWWGDGVAKLIMGIQLDLNRALKRMSQAVNIMGVPRVLYEMSSKIVKQHFNNEIGSMIGYSGTPPTFVHPLSIAQDISNWVQFLINSAFQEIGLSQLSASSQKPAGLNSKVALREYNDIETERYAAFAANWEEFHLEVARQQIDLARDLAKEHPGYGVWAKKGDGVEFIKWSEIDLKDDSWVMQVFPTSLLGNTPSGRLDRIQDLIELQMLTPEEAASLLDFPDLQSVTSVKNASFNDIQNTVETLLKGEYVSPEPFQDLNLGIKYVQFNYLKYKGKGLSEERLQYLRRWIDEAVLLANPQVAQPEQEPQMGMMPQQMQPQIQPGVMNGQPIS